MNHSDILGSKLYNLFATSRSMSPDEMYEKDPNMDLFCKWLDPFYIRYLYANYYTGQAEFNGMSSRNRLASLIRDEDMYDYIKSEMGVNEKSR